MDNLYILFLIFCSAIFAVSTDVDLTDKIPYVYAYILSTIHSRAHTTTDVEDAKDEPETDVRKEVLYEDKFKSQFRDMTEDDSHQPDKNWETTFVMEYTPVGNVIMTYDKTRETFVYYSDNIIPFRFLEVVSRKFAIHFKCKYLVVDVELEEEKMMLEITNLKKIELDTSTSNLDASNTEHPPVVEKKNVFAKFKTYNQQQSGPSASGAKEQTRIASNKSKPVVEKSNRYSCQGKLANFSIVKKVSSAETSAGRLTFSDFKKLGEYKKSLL